MCNRYRATASQAELAARYGVELPFPPDEQAPPPELFPKRPAWTVRREGDARQIDVMTWGFPPPAAGRAPVTNVRNLASPFWRSALANPARRCLVPFTEFCEWEGEKGAKIARWFSVPSQPITSFAGIWRPTETGAAMAFLTTDPNPIVAPIHPKAMPVLLAFEDEERWLTADWNEAAELVQPFPSQLMSVA
jgi:putative SOS response-associated peptidase YedK